MRQPVKTGRVRHEDALRAVTDTSEFHMLVKAA